MTYLIPLIPLMPLVGFVLTGLFGRSFQKEIHKVAIWAVVASWVVSMVVAFGALSHGFGFGDHGAGINALELDPGHRLQRRAWASSLTR